MGTQPGPNVRRRQLGRQLRALRENANKTMAEAALYAGLKVPTISRIETGKQTILPRNVRLLCQFYDIGAPMVDTLVRLAEESNERSWYTIYSDTVPNWVEWFLGLESEADEIWGYEAQAVPGQCQTADYIRAISAAARSNITEVELDRLVQLRRARQERLASRHPPRLRLVIDEAVIRRPVGGQQVMAAQLRHLSEASQQEHISLRVLPYSVGAHAAMTGAFTLLRFPDELDMNVVFLEHDHGGMYLERPSDVDRYATMFEQLIQLALSESATRVLLASLAEASDRANGGDTDESRPG